jgi:NAD(P)-dependent dehydrogenase (short-subunit alcohol dehydrogenase family)
MTQFSEKVAVISGAGIGIGQEPALLMPSLGAKAVVNDLGRGPQFGSAPHRLLNRSWTKLSLLAEQQLPKRRALNRD